MDREAKPVAASSLAAVSHAEPAPLALPVLANLIEHMPICRDEDACLEALVKARGPLGFACPRCAHPSSWRLTNRRLIE